MEIKKFDGIHIKDTYVQYEAFSEDFVESLISTAEDLSAITKISNKNKYAFDATYRKLKSLYPKEIAWYDDSMIEGKEYLAEEKERVEKTVSLVEKCEDTKVLVEIGNNFNRYALEASNQIMEDLRLLNRYAKKAKKPEDVEMFMDSYFDIIDHTGYLKYRMKAMKSLIKRTTELAQLKGLEEEPNKVQTASKSVNIEIGIDR